MSKLQEKGLILVLRENLRDVEWLNTWANVASAAAILF